MVSDPCLLPEPDPLRGSIRFACRCGVVIDSSDYPPRTSHLMPDAYADARKAHADACPMRFDPPWPFDRLPRLASQLGRVVGLTSSEAVVGELTASEGPISGATGAHVAPQAAFERRSPVVPESRLLSGVPRWIRRRTAIPGFGPSRVGSP